MPNTARTYFKSPGLPVLPGDVTTVVSIDGDYTMTPTDSLVILTATTNATITLPDATACAGKTYAIKTITLGGSTITIACHGSQEIDGSATATMDQDYEYLQAMSDGARWLVLAKSAPPPRA